MLEMDSGLTLAFVLIAASAIHIIVEASSGSAPKFKQEPIRDVVALEDGSHKFRCRVKGTPKPLLVWYRGNKMLSQNDRIKIGKYSLRISNLQTSDSGEYACQAVNTYGKIWGNFSLQVVGIEDELQVEIPITEDPSVDIKGPPEFTNRLNQVKFFARAATGSVTFHCDVLAYPKANIVWWRNGQKVKEIPGKYIFDGFKLTVKLLLLEDEGNYTCVVRNEYGSVNWTTTLEVQQRIAIAPIMEDVKNQTALIGDNVTFTCQIVMSDTQPLLQWLRHFQENDSFVNERGEPFVEIIQSSGFTSTTDDPRHLVLRNVTKEDQGWYTCLVANTVGMNYRSAWLTVVEGCEEDNGGCHTYATCEYDGGMKRCNCKTGYTGDGYTCTNMDECSGAFYPCLRDYTCEDRDPGYFCAPIIP